METKLSLAKGIAWLFYIIGGFGTLMSLLTLLFKSQNFDFANFGGVFVVFCAGLFFDLLSDIGWRVYLTTEPDKDDYDPRA